ncbi:MAG: MerR family transcriptional regulator [Acholeplasmatales bacterium]|nr:MerR family transcriptional regulator [Acholeplasmatales bacterium]
MEYTISDIAKLMGVSTYTLRYYDKEGLFPNVKRVNGIRVFEDKDFEWLRVLNCLRNINMPIKKMKEYVELCQQGDVSLKDRLKMIEEQEESINAQIKALEYYKQEIDFKKKYYEEAIKAGSESAVRSWSCKDATLELDKLPK